MFNQLNTSFFSVWPAELSRDTSMSETGDYFEVGSSVLSGSVNGGAQGSEEFLGAWDDGAILKAFDEAIRGHTVRGADKAAVLKARDEAVQQEGIASGSLFFMFLA
jgi:hypothetical protein